jgi:hypothetical protein
MATQPHEGYRLGAMQPFKAQVRNGRIVLDEPTSLPEGDVMLVPVYGSSDDRADAQAYAALPPGPDEFSSEDDSLSWEAEGWDEFYAPR